MLKHALVAFLPFLLCASSLGAEDLSASFTAIRGSLVKEAKSATPYEQAVQLLSSLRRTGPAVDTVDSDNVLNLLLHLAQGARSTEIPVRYRQVECVGQAMTFILALNLKECPSIRFESDDVMRRFLHGVLQCALVHVAEMRNSIVTGYVAAPVLGNFEPDVEPGENPPQFIIAGMDPAGIQDIKMRNRYIAKIKANADSRAMNAMQSEYPDNVMHIVRLARNFASVNLSAVSGPEADAVAQLLRSIELK